MSFNRAERIIINSKEQSVSSGDVKGTLSHSPSARNMNDGEQIFARESNKPLALYKKFNTLILDEATSAMDNKSEELIMNEIFDIQNKTIIIIINK